MNPNVYYDRVYEKFAVNLRSVEFKKGKGKWSHRVDDAFRAQGKALTDRMKVAVKTEVAEAIAADPRLAIHEQRSKVLVALVS